MLRTLIRSKRKHFLPLLKNVEDINKEVQLPLKVKRIQQQPNQHWKERLLSTGYTDRSMYFTFNPTEGISSNVLIQVASH